MKLKSCSYLKSVLFLCTLIIGLLMSTKICFAADTGSKLDGVKTLNKDTVYQYDLCGDGKTEKILFKVTVNDEKYETVLKLYINNKLCLTKKDSGISFGVELLDLDKKDNYLDFFIYTTMESDCTKNAFFIRYNGEKLFHLVKFEPDKLKNFNAYRYSIEKADGDGKVTLIIDTPIYSDAIGCYYCYVPFQFKDNKVSPIKVNTYSFAKYSSEYKYKAAKNFSVYTKAGSKVIVYKVKKGDKVTFDQLYISKSGEAYFRINNGKGKKGWIKSDLKNLFVICPAWG